MPTKPTQLRIPPHLLTQIDAAAQGQKLTRTAWLLKAAQAQLGIASESRSGTAIAGEAKGHPAKDSLQVPAAPAEPESSDQETIERARRDGHLPPAYMGDSFSTSAAVPLVVMPCFGCPVCEFRAPSPAARCPSHGRLVTPRRA